MRPGDLVRSNHRGLSLYSDESDQWLAVLTSVGDEPMVFLGTVGETMCRVLHPVHGVCRFYEPALRAIDEAR